jgi:2-dehydropantoate 2-reductase
MQRYRVAVIGPGALGLLYASRLAAVTPTAIVARDRVRAAKLRNGVRVDGKAYKPEAFGPDDLPQADWVILLVKARDTALAAKLARRMAPRGVLSLQNGIIEPVLHKTLPGVPAVQGVSTEGAWRDGAHVVHAGAGDTLVPPEFGALARHLRRAGFRVATTRGLATARLRKFLVNVCANPVTAVFRIPNGKIREQPYARYAQALAHEAVPVLAAEGLDISPEQAFERVFEVAGATARNRSSMLQDVLAGRPTEIDALTGVLLRLARRHRIAVPTHAAFYRLVRLLEGA